MKEWVVLKVDEYCVQNMWDRQNEVMHVENKWINKENPDGITKFGCNSSKMSSLLLMWCLLEKKKGAKLIDIHMWMLLCLEPQNPLMPHNLSLNTRTHTHTHLNKQAHKYIFP